MLQSFSYAPFDILKLVTTLALRAGMIFRGIRCLEDIRSWPLCLSQVCSLASLPYMSEAINNSVDPSHKFLDGFSVGVCRAGGDKRSETLLVSVLILIFIPFLLILSSPPFSLCLGLFWSSFPTPMTLAPPDMYIAVCINGLAIYQHGFTTKQNTIVAIRKKYPEIILIMDIKDLCDKTLLRSIKEDLSK